MNRGGARPGAGRKPTSPDEALQEYRLRFLPPRMEKLTCIAKDVGIPRAELLREIVDMWLVENGVYNEKTESIGESDK